MSDAKKKKIMGEIVDRLEKFYPDATCALEFGGEPWKLLVMGRLSAQCTDARVNIVCKEQATLNSVVDIYHQKTLSTSKEQTVTLKPSEISIIEFTFENN